MNSPAEIFDGSRARKNHVAGRGPALGKVLLAPAFRLPKSSGDVKNLSDFHIEGRSMSGEFIQKKRYKNFLSFYEDISPISKYGYQLREYIFRGHSSEHYELIPSALRQNNMSNLYQIKINNEDKTRYLEYQYIEQEYYLLKCFYIIASHNGLKVPYIEWIQQRIAHHSIVNELHAQVLGLYPKKIDKSVWILKEMVDIAALAQHYGVLTRLLDWTFDIHVALYFATLGACKNKNKNDFVTIWALNKNYISDYLKTKNDNPLKAVIPPYCDNPNINAQKGILTYWEIPINKSDSFPNYNNEKGVDRTALDILCSKNIKQESNKPILYKIIFPAEYALGAFKKLNDLGYNASRLFPGFQGVARQMEEQKYFWESLQDDFTA